MALIGGGILGGYLWGKGSTAEEKAISAKTIAAHMQAEGFLVTQSVVVHEEITIEKNSGYALKDFFLGQTIRASAQLRVDQGIDLTKILSNDILIGEEEIEIKSPDLEIRSVEIVGDITLENEQGIVKKLLDNEDGYNEAIYQLQNNAADTASHPQYRQAARENVTKQLARMVRLLGSDKAIGVRYY